MMSLSSDLYPYVVYHLKLMLDDKGLEELETNLTKYFSEQEILDLDSELVSIDIGKFDSYILGKIKYVKRLEEMLIKCDVEYIVNDMMPKLWEMEDVSFITQYGNDDPNPDLTLEFFPDHKSTHQQINEILRQICDKRYTKDDVLDKINEKGINSLNELNKYILNK
jgi:hypothetical protein